MIYKSIDFVFFKANNEPSSSGVTPRSLRKRTPVKDSTEAQWAVSNVSSDSDTDGSGELYIPPSTHRSEKPKSTRGFFAYQAAARQRGALVYSPQSNVTNESNVVIGVSSRGRVSGRGRIRVHGIGRQSRAEMMDEHRRIVDELHATTDEPVNREPNSPALTGGNFFNVFFSS